MGRHSYELHQMLNRINDPEMREMMEIEYDGDAWERRTPHFIPTRVELGRILENMFDKYINSSLLRRFGNDIRIYVNFGLPGLDVYILLVPLKKWIVIELKNWHEHETSPSMWNNNFFDRKLYVSIDGRTEKLQEEDVLKRYLILASERKISKSILKRMAETKTTVIQGKECFEDENYLTEENKILLIRAYVGIEKMVRTLLYGDSSKVVARSNGFAYLLSILNIVPRRSKTGFHRFTIEDFPCNTLLT